jgi:hypothetical protein
MGDLSEEKVLKMNINNNFPIKCEETINAHEILKNGKILDF